MSLQSEIVQILKDAPDPKVKLLPILPPSDQIAVYISAFSNTEGGYIILGVSWKFPALCIHGITPDFNVTPITQKAISLLSPLPTVSYDYISIDTKRIFVIKIEKSPVSIRLDNKEYKIEKEKVVEINSEKLPPKPSTNPRINEIGSLITMYKEKATRAANAFLNHYLGLLRIADNFQPLVLAARATPDTVMIEEKIMSRIILSSAVDNFEVYLGELLYEISLAKPETLKSNQTVTIEEVLNCSDIEEFVKYMARKKIAKFQKGSVREFIKDNQPIARLQILDAETQEAIEQILQIRHLFTHRNGIIDEKFILFTKTDLPIGAEFSLTTEELLSNVEYLLKIAMQLDTAAVQKYLFS